VVGTLYPPPVDEPCRLRERTRLGDAAGLTQYGVNLMRLPPGAWSSQWHWHAKEDEFLYVLSGEVVLATAPDSRPAILTGTASRTAARQPPWCWKFARASRANTRPILIST